MLAVFPTCHRLVSLPPKSVPYSSGTNPLRINVLNARTIATILTVPQAFPLSSGIEPDLSQIVFYLGPNSLTTLAIAAESLAMLAQKSDGTSSRLAQASASNSCLVSF